MKKPAVLKLNGKEPFSIQRTRPAVAKVKTFLDKQPADEIYTTPELITRTGVRALKDYRGVPELASYSEKISGTCYWGNPEAIKALREQVSQ